MLTIKTATLESNELSEELDDASLQAITGGQVTAVGGSAGLGTGVSLLGIPLVGVGASGAFGLNYYSV